MFKSIMSGADERVICIDVIGKMKGFVAQDKLKMKKQVSEWESKIVLLGQVKARLTHKGTRQNILTDILDHQVRDLRGGIKSAEHQAEVLNLAEQIVNEYSFNPESPMTSNRARSNFEITFGMGGIFRGDFATY